MSLSALFRDAPIKRKLMLIAFLSTLGAMLLAMLVSVVLQWFLLRNELAKNVHAQVSIVATNSTSALLFSDHDAAEQTLGALAAIGNIEFAGLIDKTGKELAVYVRTGSMMPLHQHTAAEGASDTYSTKYLEVVVPIVFKQERIGLIHVRSNLVPVYEQLAGSMLVTFAAATGALLVAVMMLLRLLPAITDPLLNLVGLMNTVSRGKNYTLRAEVRGKDEVGTLAQEFNDMLAQIQTRDDELARHREHLEQEVAQRTARLTEAQRIARLGNWELNLVNNNLSWSDEIYRIFGLAPQQFGATYEAFLQAVHPEDRQIVDTCVREALELGRPYSIDHRLLLPDGTVRHVHEHAEVSRNEDGQAIKMLGTVQDITESKQAEEKIRESEARYRGIFEYADDIIYLLAPDGTFKSLSPSFERLTGWHPEEWLGRPFESIIHPDDLPRALEIFQSTLSGQPTPAFELRIAKKSGEYFDSELSIVPVDPGGEIAAIGIARDVTVRKQTEEKIRLLNEVLEQKVKERTQQLIEAQEELVRKEKLAVLGQVAGSVGHELRNPLGVMSNAVFFLQSVLPDADENVKEYLNIIKSEIAGSERIVSDLLDSVRTKPPHIEIMDVRELLAQTLRTLSIPSAVSVKLNIPETLSHLRADQQQIRQVFRNLISNAVEAMPEGGTLEIQANEDAQTRAVTVSVRDSGSGMTPEQLGKLFQPLFTTKARGIGLGLVVVKNLMQANGGRLEVQSEPGKGTTFSITLPSAGAVPEPAAGGAGNV